MNSSTVKVEVTQEQLAALVSGELAKQRKKVNHFLHLLLSLATGGLWLIVWAYLVYKASK